MGFIEGAKRFLHIAAVTGTVAAASEGVAAAKSVEHPPEMTPHADVQLSPTKAFEIARSKAIEVINDGQNDPGSFGEQSNANWTAVMEDGGKDALPIVKITVRSGGKEVVSRFRLVKGEPTADEKGNIRDAYSFETDPDGKVEDVEEANRRKEAEATLAQAMGQGPKTGGGHVAMGDGE